MKIEPVVRVVDVYPYRRRRNGTEFLVCRRASHEQFAGQWRMIAGKIERGETAWQAGLRELQEETQYVPLHYWTIPSLNLLYQWHRDRVNLIPAFAAEVDKDPVLNHEHNAFQWLPAEEAAAHLTWPEQRRLLLLAAQMLSEGVPAQLVIPRREVLATLRGRAAA